MSNCRGCIRFEQSKYGVSYDFRSEEGWMPKIVVFDTAKLLKIAEPRPVIIASSKLPAFEYAVETHEMFEEHIDHVDQTKPIIVGDFTFTNAATNCSEVFQLIPDGHHRLAKCMKLNEPVKIYHLTEAEMRAGAYFSTASYLRSQGMFFIGSSDEEVEEMFNSL